MVPHIRRVMNNPHARVGVTGASFGAFHAANQFFRRPDLFDTLVAMSGFYDLEPDYTDEPMRRPRAGAVGEPFGTLGDCFLPRLRYELLAYSSATRTDGAQLRTKGDRSMSTKAPLLPSQRVVQICLFLVATISMIGGPLQMVLGEPETTQRLDARFWQRCFPRGPPETAAGSVAVAQDPSNVF